MFATLPAASADQPVFSVANLVILVIVAAIVYPLQKKLRAQGADPGDHSGPNPDVPVIARAERDVEIAT